jgi:hypothetical protein
MVKSAVKSAPEPIASNGEPVVERDSTMLIAGAFVVGLVMGAAIFLFGDMEFWWRAFAP